MLSTQLQCRGTVRCHVCPRLQWHISLPALLCHMHCLDAAQASASQLVLNGLLNPACLSWLQASLDDLNNRLEDPLPMNRFRPNIVLDGCSAWAEDGWESFTAGTAEGSSSDPIDFALVKPCDRCKVGIIAACSPLHVARTISHQRLVLPKESMPTSLNAGAVTAPDERVAPWMAGHLAAQKLRAQAF